jgi:hypothetical protein
MEIVTDLLGNAKQWYTERPIGYYVLTGLALAWITHIVKQLVDF